jgi:quinol monooxygenase YgiN
MTIGVLVEWHVKPDKIATAKALLQETFTGTVNYPGCQRYMVYEDPESLGSIILLTEWNSREEYAAYMEWRKTTGILGQFGETFASPPKVRYLDSIM